MCQESSRDGPGGPAVLPCRLLGIGVTDDAHATRYCALHTMVG